MLILSTTLSKNKIPVKKERKKKSIARLMAAYAALVSVMNIIETIQNHPRPPISFDKEQLQSLTRNITFLQEFLETHSIDDDGLESRIADAAYAAEDVIESHIVDQIEAISSGADFYDGLHKVIQDLSLIQRDMPSFAKKTTGIKDDDGHQHNNYSSMGQEAAVGFEDILVEAMNKLTWNQSNRQIIPIIGMGGIGKTTFARNIYVNPVIQQYFDFRAWATISQVYNSKEILLEILLCLNMEVSDKSSEDELGVKLHKVLCGRKYLIVLDDMWSIDAWDRVKTFFPNSDGNNGSAVIVTTRLSNLAFQLSDSCLEMSFLDEGKSWNLFCKITFGEESFPQELEGIGKKIVENCKGLPLSIVVIGGLLAKSKQTKEYWLYIVENLNSIVNLQDDERCLKILHFSYKELPVHLKPCFLYMGIYAEDSVIHVGKLIKLWVAEGFLKPISGKCSEVVAREYFNDLLSKNLILVHERGYSGETVKCKVHDLLVDLCIRETEKHKFLYIARPHSLDIPNTQRRFAVHDRTVLLTDKKPRSLDSRLSRAIYRKINLHGSLVRSLTYTYSTSPFDTCIYSVSPLDPFHFRLLRVWNSSFEIGFPKSTRGLVNCRFIRGLHIDIYNPTFPSSISSFWNLQTLDFRARSSCTLHEVETSEIWKMPQLRHVYFHELYLPDVPEDEEDYFVLLNLQTLQTLNYFIFSEGAIKRIPNLKKLKVTYDGFDDRSDYRLNNLVQLNNLESLTFELKRGSLSDDVLRDNLIFPLSLKKLTLSHTRFDWGEMETKIGSLPHLQILRLEEKSFQGPEWETVEGQFCSLKYLEMYKIRDLKYWRTESWTHFPCLEHLVLTYVSDLEEIPSEIGETLKSIKIKTGYVSAIFSAKEILMEQESLGNEGLHVQVTMYNGDGSDADYLAAVNSLVAPNFQLDYYKSYYE